MEFSVEDAFFRLGCTYHQYMHVFGRLFKHYKKEDLDVVFRSMLTDKFQILDLGDSEWSLFKYSLIPVQIAILIDVNFANFVSKYIKNPILVYFRGIKTNKREYDVKSFLEAPIINNLGGNTDAVIFPKFTFEVYINTSYHFDTNSKKLTKEELKLISTEPGVNRTQVFVTFYNNALYWSKFDSTRINILHNIRSAILDAHGDYYNKYIYLD